jgi:hypothetical protein
VAQELGGKSPNIILPSADLAAAVKAGVEACFGNTGQSCDAPTRMFVPAALHDAALVHAAEAAAAVVVGDPTETETTMGPLISKLQFDKVQRLIQAGIDEGATLVCGGIGRPQGLNHGWFAKPTIFGHVKNEMTVSREEIFGPVLVILPYDSIDHAVEMANDTPYGLAAYIAGSVEEAKPVAPRASSPAQNTSDALEEIDDEDLIPAMPVRRPVAIGLLPGARPAPLTAPVQLAQASNVPPSVPGVTSIPKTSAAGAGSMPLPPPRPVSLGLIR